MLLIAITWKWFLRNKGLLQVTLASWNPSFEDDLDFNDEEIQGDEVNSNCLQEIILIDDETDYQGMENFIFAISNCKISKTLKNIKMTNSILDPFQVQKIIDSFKLSIKVD